MVTVSDIDRLQNVKAFGWTITFQHTVSLPREIWADGTFLARRTIGYSDHNVVCLWTSALNW